MAESPTAWWCPTCKAPTKGWNLVHITNGEPCRGRSINVATDREIVARQLAFAGMPSGWRWGDWDGLTPAARAYWLGRADAHIETRP